MSSIERDTRSFADRQQKPRALSPREQLALTLLADEWSEAELQMCFEVATPSKYVTDLSLDAVRAIATYQRKRQKSR